MGKNSKIKSKINSSKNSLKQNSLFERQKTLFINGVKKALILKSGFVALLIFVMLLGFQFPMKDKNALLLSLFIVHAIMIYPVSKFHRALKKEALKKYVLGFKFAFSYASAAYAVALIFSMINFPNTAYLLMAIGLLFTAIALQRMAFMIKPF